MQSSSSCALKLFKVNTLAQFNALWAFVFIQLGLVA